MLLAAQHRRATALPARAAATRRVVSRSDACFPIPISTPSYTLVLALAWQPLSFVEIASRVNTMLKVTDLVRQNAHRLGSYLQGLPPSVSERLKRGQVRAQTEKAGSSHSRGSAV